MLLFVWSQAEVGRCEERRADAELQLAEAEQALSRQQVLVRQVQGENERLHDQYNTLQKQLHQIIMDRQAALAGAAEALSPGTSPMKRVHDLHSALEGQGSSSKSPNAGSSTSSSSPSSSPDPTRAQAQHRHQVYSITPTKQWRADGSSPTAAVQSSMTAANAAAAEGKRLLEQSLEEMQARIDSLTVSSRHGLSIALLVAQKNRRAVHAL